MGLSLEEFALLNVVWAVSIIALEVPSGALADTIGRCNLLRAAGILMVIEMILLVLAARGLASLLFPVLTLNRILSGVAEAAASGSDEAIAYDSLQRAGLTQDWPRVLERQMMTQAAAFILSSMIGAAVYDVQLVQWLFQTAGSTATVTRELTLQLPPILCLGMAMVTLFITFRFDESIKSANHSAVHWWQIAVEAGRLTLRAGNWILITPRALTIIAAGLVFDSTIRMFLTLNSQYFRVIDLPEWTFGLIGSALSVLGLAMPSVARWLTIRFRPAVNFGLLAVLIGVGLTALTLRVPLWGLFAVIPLFMSMFLLGFFVSHYLNEITSSDQRATVLSFRGLAFNLAYAGVGILYAALVSFLRQDGFKENDVFNAALPWFPGYFAVITALLALFAWSQFRRLQSSCHS